MIKKYLAVIMTMAIALSLSACSKQTIGESKKKEVSTIKIGTLASTEPRCQLVKEILKEINIDSEVLLFEGNAGPATALKDGDVDGIIVNHLPWIQAFNKANNSNLVMIQPYAYYCPTRMYSSKWSSVEEIPNDASICISNDPSNLDVALTMLDSVGLIKLGKKTDSYYSEADIISNPKNIKLHLTDTVYVISSYKSCDAIICFSIYAVKGKGEGVDASKFLCENPTDKQNFPCGLIVRAEDKDAEWAKYVAEKLASDEYINKAIAIFGEGAHGYYN